MYSLLQVEIIANKLFLKRLYPHRYFEMPHTPGLWHHQWWSITFTLVVDNIGVKYVGHKNTEYLMAEIKENYTLFKDWTGSIYCCISLQWYCNEHTAEINISKYIVKQLQ